MAAVEKEKQMLERLTLVWLRIKGYPVWPGIIVTLQDVPEREFKACYRFVQFFTQ